MRALLRSPDVRTIAITVVAVIIWHVIAYFIDFNAWVLANPPARITYHVLGVLIFGAVGLAGIFASTSPQDDMRPIFYRLAGILFLGIAAVFIWMLITGQTAAELMA